MSVSQGDLCFICDESLSNGEVTLVNERGVNRLRESSVKRKINAHSYLLKNVIEIKVHSACQKQYNNEKLIAAFLKRDESKPVPGPSRRSSGPAYTFKNHCFLSGNEVPKDFLEKQLKLPLERRDHVFLCGKLSMRHYCECCRSTW